MKEDDVEKKIFVENGLDALVLLAQGKLEDGDGKVNESVKDSPCSDLSESICKEAHNLFVKIVHTWILENVSLLTGESKMIMITEWNIGNLTDLRKIFTHIAVLLEKVKEKEELLKLKDCIDPTVSQAAEVALSKL